MREVVAAFDRYLAERGLRFEGTVIGGAALILMGVIDRPTEDVDCLDPRISPNILDAANAFAAAYEGPHSPLKEGWLNNGPESLQRDLPTGWQERTKPLFRGRSLVLRTLGRLDLLRAKLFAYCDRQQDLNDCEALKPTLAELRAIRPWLEDRDGNPVWPSHVRTSLSVLAERLGYEYSP